MNSYFNIEDTVYKITNEYEEAVDLLVQLGFEQFMQQEQREKFGKNISLKMALQMKQVNLTTFEERLVEAIKGNRESMDASLVEKTKNEVAEIRVDGVLPCPVKIPLMEGFEGWLNQQEQDYRDKIDYELKAASMGVQWLVESIEKSETADVLSDLFISAGFDLFFDRHLIGKYKEQGAFTDFTGMNQYNKDFENEDIVLKDPKGQYSMLAVVPAVFLVNTQLLDGRKMPTSWKDILSPEFENSVSLPIGDFDLFNAILLNIHKEYGDEGIKQLGKSLLKSMHPSEMVKSHNKKTNKPVVTIMPYFFTKMTKKGGPMAAVWPEDGAIISPIFMLSKSNEQEALQPIVDYFSSQEVGEILSHQGLFPSVHPQVDNMISDDHKYMWVGWDYIDQVDIGALLKELEELFHSSTNQ